jgi:hypothetical protein
LRDVSIVADQWTFLSQGASLGFSPGGVHRIEIDVNGTRIYIAVSGYLGNSGLAKTALQRLGSDGSRFSTDKPLARGLLDKGPLVLARWR